MDGKNDQELLSSEDTILRNLRSVDSEMNFIIEEMKSGQHSKKEMDVLGEQLGRLAARGEALTSRRSKIRNEEK